MFFCEKCRVEADWPKSLRGYFDSRGRCEVCRKERDCYNVPSYALPNPGPKDDWAICEVKGCKESALNGRLLCDPHAYPAEQKKSGRRQAIEAQKAKKAKVSHGTAEE